MTKTTNDLVKRLRIKAGVMSMGEKIAWGSDTALMEEAADELERLTAVETHVDALILSWRNKHEEA